MIEWNDGKLTDEQVAAMSDEEISARMDEFQVVFALAASPFLAQRLAVMVLHNVRSDDFNEAKDGIFIVALNLTQRPKVVAAQLEVGLLDKIVDQGSIGLSPAAKGFNDHAGNHGLEGAHEFVPKRFAPPGQTLA